MLAAIMMLSHTFSLLKGGMEQALSSSFFGFFGGEGECKTKTQNKKPGKICFHQNDIKEM